MHFTNGKLTLNLSDILKLIFLPLYLIIWPVLYWKRKANVIYRPTWRFECQSQEYHFYLMKIFAYIFILVLTVGIFLLQWVTFNRNVISVEETGNKSGITHIMVIEESCKYGLRESKNYIYCKTASDIWHLIDSTGNILETYTIRWSYTWELSRRSCLSNYLDTYMQNKKEETERQNEENVIKDQLKTLISTKN